LRHQTHRSVNFLPHVRNPLTDKAIAEDISNMERKLKAFKAKYPELSGIAPATSPEELLNKTRVS
jgi:hypothetical protein